MLGSDHTGRCLVQLDFVQLVVWLFGGLHLRELYESLPRPCSDPCSSLRYNRCYQVGDLLTRGSFRYTEFSLHQLDQRPWLPSRHFRLEGLVFPNHHRKELLADHS